MFQLLLNTEASKDNLLELIKSDSTCCGDTAVSPCKYKFAANANPFTGFTAKDKDGVDHEFTTAGLTSRTEIATFISESLRTIGYLQTDNQFRSIDIEDPVNTISITGECVIVNLKFGATTLTPATVSCTRVVMCDYIMSLEYDKDPTMLGSALPTTEQIGTTAGFPAGDVAPVKAAYETALTNAGIAFESVTVTENLIAGLYQVKIKKQTSPFYVGTLGVAGCNCAATLVV